MHVIQTDPSDGDQYIEGEIGTVRETLEKVNAKSRRQLSAMLCVTGFERRCSPRGQRIKTLRP